MNIEFIEKYNFYKITCLEGHFVTNFDSSKQKYSEYYASKTVYCPSREAADTFYCISDSENKEFELLRDEAIRLEEEQYEKDNQLEEEQL